MLFGVLCILCIFCVFCIFCIFCISYIFSIFCLFYIFYLFCIICIAAPARRRRTRDAIWWNLPYSINIDTNIGAKFLPLIDKCFPKGTLMGKIFNRQTLKILKNLPQHQAGGGQAQQESAGRSCSQGGGEEL